MFNWLWKMLGLHVCDWTKWEKKQANYARPVDFSEDFAQYQRGKTEIEFTRIWQERTCKECGKTQQERLRH